MESIGHRLREAREASGYTLEQLAQAIGYRPSTISNVENGHDRPGKRLAQACIAALQLNADWLLDGKGEMFTPEHRAGLAEVEARLGVRHLHDARKAHVVRETESIYGTAAVLAEKLEAASNLLKECAELIRKNQKEKP